MGSVLSEIECPQCGCEECSSDFYYKSGEEYIFCVRCGYSYTNDIVNRDLYDKSENWTPQFKTTEKNGMGVFKYSSTGSGYAITGIYKKNDAKSMSKDILKHNEESEDKIVEASYTFQDNGDWFVHNVLTGERAPWTPRGV